LGLDWSIGHLTILCFICVSKESAMHLLGELEKIAFPPGERSSSGLSFDTATADGVKRFDYWVASSAGSVIVTIDHVPAAVSEAAVQTLSISGAVAIIFGYFSEGEVHFIPPAEYSLYRSSLTIDGKRYDGEGSPPGFTWRAVMAAVQEDLELG
jgi:hypothetical protein